MRFDRPELPEAPTLFDSAPQLVRPGATETIGEAFDEFHRANPWVYEALAKLARQWLAAGHRRVSIGALFEVLRWNYGLATRDVASDFKLNNNYRSRYARLLMAQESDLADAFETRELRAA